MFNLILGSLPSFANINRFAVLDSCGGIAIELPPTVPTGTGNGGKDRYNEVFLYAVVLILFK
ncbi:hypothetical protein D3C71_946100 [compost metagenome]